MVKRKVKFMKNGHLCWRPLSWRGDHKPYMPFYHRDILEKHIECHEFVFVVFRCEDEAQRTKGFEMSIRRGMTWRSS